MGPHKMHWLFSIFLLLTAVALPASAIYYHVQELRQPDVQWIMCKILLCVPIYAVQAFFSMFGYLSSDQVCLWRMLRDLYACYCVYLFVTPLMFHYLGSYLVALVHMDTVEVSDILGRSG